MKKFTILVFAIVVMASSCFNNRHIIMEENSERDCLFFLDVKENNWSEGLYFPQDDNSWKIEPAGLVAEDYNHQRVEKNELVLKRMGSQEFPIPVGSASDSFYFGDENWENYIFSFDFILNEGSYLRFTVYDECLSTDWNYSLEGEINKQPVEFVINKNGLYYHTLFEDKIIKCKDSKGTFIIPSVETDIWNHVEAFMVENKLHLIFNGKDAGECFRFCTMPYGRVSLGGDFGCMFRNIIVENSIAKY